MTSSDEEIRVAHETVLGGCGVRPLHILTIAAEQGDGRDWTSLFALLSPESSERWIDREDIDALLSLLAPRSKDTGWMGQKDPHFLPSTYLPAAKLLLEQLSVMACDPVALAQAALASLLAPSSPRARPTGQPSEPPPPGVSFLDPHEFAPHVAATLFNGLLDEIAVLPVSITQLRMLLSIAADASVAGGAGASDRYERYARYEIPYGLSPQTRASSLETVIQGARALALLPLGTGATEAVTTLGQGHFMAAGEFALGGSLVTVVLATGVALAERALAWGQPHALPGPRGPSGGDRTE